MGFVETFLWLFHFYLLIVRPLFFFLQIFSVCYFEGPGKKLAVCLFLLAPTVSHRDIQQRPRTNHHFSSTAFMELFVKQRNTNRKQQEATSLCEHWTETATPAIPSIANKRAPAAWFLDSSFGDQPARSDKATTLLGNKQTTAKQKHLITKKNQDLSAAPKSTHNPCKKAIMHQKGENCHIQLNETATDQWEITRLQPKITSNIEKTLEIHYIHQKKLRPKPLPLDLAGFVFVSPGKTDGATVGGDTRSGDLWSDSPGESSLVHESLSVSECGKQGEARPFFTDLKMTS